MNGPQKIRRETCEHCQYKDIPNGCDGCLAGIAYDCEDEIRRMIYYTEVSHLSERFNYKQIRKRHSDMKSGHIRWGKL